MSRVTSHGFQNLILVWIKNSPQFAPKCRTAVSHKWAFKRGLNCWDYIRTECLLVWNTVMFLSTNSLVVTFVYERECARRSIIGTSLLFALYSWRAAFSNDFKYFWIEKRLRETPSSIMTWTALCTWGGLLTIRLSGLIIERFSSCCCYTNKYGVTWKALQ